MNQRRITNEELRRLRNDIGVDEVIRVLGQPLKCREGHFRFLCPICSEFHTDTNAKTNLARCFRCDRNFNAIDLIMIVERVSFLDAVHTLRDILASRQVRPRPSNGPRTA